MCMLHVHVHVHVHVHARVRVRVHVHVHVACVCMYALSIVRSFARKLSAVITPFPGAGVNAERWPCKFPPTEKRKDTHTLSLHHVGCSRLNCPEARDVAHVLGCHRRSHPRLASLPPTQAPPQAGPRSSRPLDLVLGCTSIGSTLGSTN